MKSFSWSYKLLHWLMAVLIMVMFLALLGFNPDMSEADRKVMLIGHSSIGTLVTLLMLIRVCKRFVLKHARPRHALAPWQARAAKWTHYALYLFMGLVPLTGYLTANFHQLPVRLFGSIPLNGSPDDAVFTSLRLVHSTSVKLLIALVIVHVAAALIHKFVLKDKVLSGMRPWFAAK